MGILNSLTSLIGKKQDATVPTPANPAAVAPPIELKKILVVEDDKELRDFYSDFLSSEGYAISTAENGKLGLEAIIAQKPDLILLDLMMPVMDGKTLLHSMRQIPEFKVTPVIILSNAGDADSIRETKVFENADEFLIKANITPDVLLKKIKSLII